MTGWVHLFLGIIAVATLVTAVVQIVTLVYAGMIGRRVVRLMDRVDQELKPLSASVNAVGRDAARAAALAVAQVERVDQLFTGVTERVEQTAQALQRATSILPRERAAFLVGVRAAVGAFREARGRRSARTGRTDDEDALFIG